MLQLLAAVVIAPAEIKMESALVLPSVGRYGRAPIQLDSLQAEIVGARTVSPYPNEVVKTPSGGDAKWTRIAVGSDGALTGQALNGGYVYWRVDAESESVKILEAAGHGMVYVNGEPRGGDVYSFGYTKTPVLLVEGKNEFLFHVSRGRLTAKLSEPPSDLAFSPQDMTVPDIHSPHLPGTMLFEKPSTYLGAIVVCNFTTEWTKGISVESITGDAKPLETDVPPLPPLGYRKVMFRIRPPEQFGGEIIHLTLRLKRNGRPESEWATVLRIRSSTQTFKNTFISEIDGSVQYYAVRPASFDVSNPSLALSCHGAGVEAIGQADAYGEPNDFCIVCPTNRRPYGFDWEDWGRMDFLEVLARATRGIPTERVFLTGHSMGGHGAWILGAQFPDRFLAIGPSAGWESFWTYAGGATYPNPTPVENVLIRASSTSDTSKLVTNFGSAGVYILHGDADDNVPVAQARNMAAKLRPFHRNHLVHEQKGAGHWWDAETASGADCLTWKPMFDFFREQPRKTDETIDFVTSNPGVSADCLWATIEQQREFLKPSRIQLTMRRGEFTITGTTENVATVSLRFPSKAKEWHITFDGQPEIVATQNAGAITLRLEDNKWKLGGTVPPAMKNPTRNGPFKDAFRNRMVFVYATKGTPEENTWSLCKARFDAETFWYRGNGSIEIVPDNSFKPEFYANRNIIIYGNSDTNGAWKALLSKSPIQVTRTGVEIDGKKTSGSDIGCLFLRPFGANASVGVVGGTGLEGCRTTDRLPYFVSGVAYPDFTIFRSTILTKGTEGIITTGFFGNDWSMKLAQKEARVMSR